MRRYLVLAAVLSACQQDPLGRCTSFVDCQIGQECSAGVCTRLATDHQPGSRCMRDADCAAWATCAAEACVLTPGMCGTGADCAAWQACDGTHACVTAPGFCADGAGCEAWETCPAASHVCTLVAGRCNSTLDCQEWEACDGTNTCVLAAGRCTPTGGCQPWESCGTDHLCALTPGMCGTGADCASWDLCDGTYTCVHAPGYCGSDPDCATWQTCDTSVHACVTAAGHCADSTGCAVWEACNAASHICENGPGYCADDTGCAAWQTCDASVHACVARAGFCAGDGGCAVWEVCNPTSHTCENGPQYCASSATCEAWQQCGAQHVCEPGLRRCGKDADCEYSWQACESDHVCGTAPGHCLDSSDCTAPQLCYQDHVCKTPPAHCTSDWDCPWYKQCTGGLGTETCQLKQYPQHCDGVSDCPAGMACPDHLCVNTWRVTQVEASGFVTCALTSDQDVWCWGWNNARQLGGENPLYGGPLLVSGTNGTVALANEGGTNIVTYGDGTVRGWGYNTDGQLCETPDNPPYRTTPGPVIPALAGVTQIHGHPLCGIDATANLVCWGENAYGAIPGAPSNVDTPTPITALPSGVTAFDGTCAVAAGELWCWSGTFGNDCGQAGGTPGVTNGVPTRIDLGAPVLDVAMGAGFTCAILQGGAVKCWGCNYYGNVGNGLTSVDPVLVPATVAGLVGPAVHVEAADQTACVLLASGGVQCWGRGDLGYLGTGDKPAAQVTPKYAFGLESGVAQLDMGMAQCALKTDGTLWCWGNAHDWTMAGDFTWPFFYPVQVNAPP